MTTPDDQRELAPRRRWLAIGAATVPQVFGYLSIAAAFTTDSEGESLVGAGGAALGLGLVPFVFLLLAFVSNHLNASIAVLKAMGWFLLIALPLGLVGPAWGAAVGFAAGGTAALRPAESTRTKVRWVAVGLLAVYILLLLLTAPAAGLFAGALLPLVTIGFADEYSEWSARRRQAPEVDA